MCALFKAIHAHTRNDPVPIFWEKHWNHLRLGESCWTILDNLDTNPGSTTNTPVLPLVQVHVVNKLALASSLDNVHGTYEHVSMVRINNSPLILFQLIHCMPDKLWIWFIFHFWHVGSISLNAMCKLVWSKKNLVYCIPHSLFPIPMT